MPSIKNISLDLFVYNDLHILIMFFFNADREIFSNLHTIDLLLHLFDAHFSLNEFIHQDPREPLGISISRFPEYCKTDLFFSSLDCLAHFLEHLLPCAENKSCCSHVLAYKDRC